MTPNIGDRVRVTHQGRDIEGCVIARTERLTGTILVLDTTPPTQLTLSNSRIDVEFLEE